MPKLNADGIHLLSVDAAEAAKTADCVVIVTDHTGFDYAGIVEAAPLLVDSRNALKKFKSDKIVRL